MSATKKSKDVLTPAPKKGDVLAVYNPESSVWGLTTPEERKGLARVANVAPSGVITLAGPYGGSVFFANGASKRSTCPIRVRWPTDEDRAEYSRKFLVNALLAMPWGMRTDEEREAVAKILNIEVQDP